MPVDPFSRVIKCEAWIDGRPAQIAVVCHPDQVTVVCGENRSIELEASVFRLLVMRALVRMALVSRPRGRKRPHGAGQASTGG